ncbi:TonB-dependent receptor [Undibacterium fentianense]|uniref:TonB-dependent receptor n=1 Tax=Undibacterium fentianense TaxID=2828728 RepID=A0A941EAK1_9BURK|nr:TonB-dependent receptor [Undibacterium fentianense]MBR7801578.1 TonB-dependent receptor [Undibacterium fentianense]
MNSSKQSKAKLVFLTRSAAAVLAIYGSSVSYAFAQSTDNTAKANDETSVAKVVVSARRREETLQDVPVSVTAYSADQISKAGVADVTGLALTLPNTTLSASRGTNSTLTSFMRGVGQQDPLAGFESGVGIYLDDIYLARPQGAVADIYDVERVEVLRGPQGTLYGRNTIGGAVKYVTRKMGPATDMRLKASVGSYGQMDGVFTASTALSDTVRVGGTLAKFKRNGFGTNLATGEDNYNKDVSAARLSAEFMPNSDLFIRISADTSQDDSNPKHGHRLTVGKISNAPVLDNVYDTRANLNTALGHKQQVTQTGVSALVEYQVQPDLMFKSVTASRHDTSYAPIDFDSLNKVDFDVPALYKNKQFSQEFQLTYTGKAFQGVAGVYYIDANAYDKFDVRLLGTSTFTEGDIDTKAWAAFADASFDLSKDLSLSIGGRYTVDKREASILRQIYLGTAGSPGMGNPAAVLFRTDTNLSKADLSREDKKFTPRISLGWKASADQNVYASWTEGFKGGGFDPRLNLVGTKLTVDKAKQGFLPEKISTFELGLKSAFAKNTVFTNVAVFHSDYQDVQIPGSVAIDTNGDGKDDSFAGVTTNAGKAKIDGIEIEATARVTDAFSLSGMLSYIDAKYTKYVGAGNIDVASQRVFQNTPKQTASIRASYDWDMAMLGNGGKLTLSSSVAFRGKTYQFETPTPILDQDSYNLFDASLVWTRTDGRVRVGLHGKNLNDARYKVAGYLFPTLGEGSTTAFYGNPRTYTLTLDYRF